MTAVSYKEFNDTLVAYRPMLKSIARRFGARSDAEDLVQTAIVLALSNRERFTHGGVAGLRAWLAAILRNCVLSRNKRIATHHRKLHATGVIAVGVNVFTPSEDPEYVLMAKQAMGAVGGLKPNFRNAIVDNVRGLTYAERSAKRGVEEGTVKSRLYRAQAEMARVAA
jgi:RNA polymerase sigma factor (sigma-70 family)